MSRKYKQAQKRRNKSAVQKYRCALDRGAYNHWQECLSENFVEPKPTLWARIASWFRR